MDKRILLTGGAGYIGSHTAVMLIENGYQITIADNYCNSSPEAIDRIAEITGSSVDAVRCDFCSEAEVEELFSSRSFSAVIHFAGLKAVAESVEKPELYRANNIGSTKVLIEAMKRHGVKDIVFSSSATVYSVPNLSELLEASPSGITEDFPLGVNNPYGETKLKIEEILKDSGLNCGILRYFNPIGAHPSGLIGESPVGIPNNLLPYVLKVASGELPHLNVYGNDYDTPDGTAIRDYIHVMDLAAGHLAMLRHMGGYKVYNLGTGRGSSVLEVLRACEKAVGHTIPYVFAPRRPGDMPKCWADASKAEKELGWKAERGLDEMCRDAWRFVNK